MHNKGCKFCKRDDALLVLASTDSPSWQDRLFHGLAALYGIVAVVALVQLIRIQLRVPEYGWTTQKVFNLLNFVVNGARCSVFIFPRDIQQMKPEISILKQVNISVQANEAVAILV